MKIQTVALATLFSISTSLIINTPARADAGVFVGIVYNFGPKSDLGFSAKLVSDDAEDKVVGALGVSYFPAATYKLGADIGLGYTFENGLVTAGYDIFNKKPQFGLGYMDTQD